MSKKTVSACALAAAAILILFFCWPNAVEETGPVVTPDQPVPKQLNNTATTSME